MIMRGIQSGIRSGIDSGVNGHLSGAVPVIWTAIVNCTAAGNTLERTTGSGWDGGAVSVQAIPAGADGYVQLTVGSITDNVMCGLSVGNTDATHTDIDHAIFLNAGTIKVYESGTSIGSYGAYLASDLFRVVRTGSTITYERDNGSGFVAVYTSLAPSSGDALTDCSLNNTGASIVGVTMGGAA